MNKDSNKFIVIFASILVVVVALLLTFTHEALRGTQQRNENIDKMSQILRSVKVHAEGVETESIFDKMISDVYLVDNQGNMIPDTKDEAFVADMKVELAKSEDQRRLPVYEAVVDGQKKYILALYGTGLWGPLWGYIAVNDDGNTVFGADFSHSGETPGLGAEISQSWFGERFQGKQLFQDGVFKSVAVVKPGKGTSDRDYVDGISGGTITGNGVDHMLYDTLEAYSSFLNKLKNK